MTWTQQRARLVDAEDHTIHRLKALRQLISGLEDCAGMLDPGVVPPYWKETLLRDIKALERNVSSRIEAVNKRVHLKIQKAKIIEIDFGK